MTDTNDNTKNDESGQDTLPADVSSDETSPELTGNDFPVESSAPVIAKEIEIVVEDDDEEDKPLVEEAPVAVETFEELGLAEPLMAAIQKLNWTKPTLIQGLGLPLTTKGQDLAGFSQTGTGKTGVFLITIAHQLLKMREAGVDISKDPKAIILAPTRELAVQISSDAELLFNQLGISSMAVYGGVDYEKQAQTIRAGIDVIVATPGRLKDYFQKKVFSTKDCCLFICDEADRMLDMGFIDDVEFFLSKLSPDTQKMLFSATTNEKVKELAFEYLENPQYISANPEIMTPERIKQFAVICESTEKLQVMLGLLRDHNPVCSVIFTNTKIVAEWLQYKLNNNGIEADLITGDLPQTKRIALVQRIKNNEVKALIATDVASRGLHISSITHVYNFDLPDDAANYVHRIGRTARAGAEGSAYSLVCEDYGHNLLAIQKYLGENIPIETHWFPAEYLQIEDKAANPYKDSNFKGNRMKDEDSQRSGGRSQGGRSQQGGRSGGRSEGEGRGGSGSGATGGRPQANRGRPDENSKGPRPRGDRSPRPERTEGEAPRQGQGRQPKHSQQANGQAGAGGERRPHKKAHTGSGSDTATPQSERESKRGPNQPGHQKPREPQQGGERKLKVLAPAGPIIKPVQPIKKNQDVPNTLLGLFKKIFSAFFKSKK
ncbi:MAG: DEAD/DEAH box helicase [Proteobacteria bacterium]|nr:MAG: DEAD/DEAH box helicase [Pseudomonadota bacterium]